MPVTETSASPWHPGEVALQRTMGVDAHLAEIGSRLLRDAMPEQHRTFFAKLPFVVLGTVDPAGDAWATVRVGEPGFVASPDARTLTVAAGVEPGDPAEAGMADGDAVGLLGIELHTRRRNRANGLLRREGAGGFRIEVVQSFGNCPQYIQERHGQAAAADTRASTVEELTGLDDDARATIVAADTLFVASYADLASGRQVDVSHRGGRAGFVRIEPSGVLVVPDFSGNRFFNTLGNIVLSRRAGVTFVDFASGDLLQLSGEAAVLAGGADAVQGAERLWALRPRRIVRRRGALALRWSFAGWSPATLRTGTWPAQDAAGLPQSSSSR
jgi:predicted pyridoxine 5'-phosphate oxidase superfamily flavin-nucleotide-binding protein